MNEACEIRLGLLEMFGRDDGIHPETIVETVLNLERFIWNAGVANPKAEADSAAPAMDPTGTA